MKLGLDYILKNNDAKGAAKLVERFQSRVRFQGCAIYKADGDLFAVTERISDWKLKDKAYIKEIEQNKIAVGKFQKLEDYPIYSYIVPVIGDGNDTLGAVEVIYDTSYIFSNLAELWRRVSLSLVIIIVLMLFVMLLLRRQLFVIPVMQLTEWFKHFQKGEINIPAPGVKSDELGKLASEVEQIALNLRVARKAVSEVAAHRIEKEDLWTQTKLHNLIRRKTWR